MNTNSKSSSSREWDTKIGKTRVTDPGGVDPDPTFKKKSDPNPTLEKIGFYPRKKKLFKVRPSKNKHGPAIKKTESGSDH